jgi:hypothetical protein
MKRNIITLTTFTLNLAIGAALASPADNTSETTRPTRNRTTADVVRAGENKDVRDLQPFTHFARIPAESNKSTIRFESAKMVQVPTLITYATNSTYCEELGFRDPGGSMYCPSVKTGSPAMAYEVTYSYIGQPMASDESGSRNFTFRVYLRLDELAPDVRRALTDRKWDRAEVAEHFAVNTLREPARRIVIDEAKSHFCAGNFVDGIWTRTDANCKDEIHTKAIDGLSDYTTVRVDPVLAAAGLASAGAARTPSSGGK